MSRTEERVVGTDYAIQLEPRPLNWEEPLFIEPCEDGGVIIQNQNRQTLYCGHGYWERELFIRHGAGKEYRADGTLRYEGEFFNGEITGRGTAYDEKGDPIYQGEFLNGQWHGTGLNYYTDKEAERKVHIEGEFQHGFAHGQVRAYYPSGILSYEGSTYQGKIHGRGRKYRRDTGRLLYEGEVDMGCANGVGRVYYEDGTLEYEGEIDYGHFSGAGRKYTRTGILLYEGQFLCGAYHGQGRLYDAVDGELIRDDIFSDDPESCMLDDCQNNRNEVRLCREKAGLPTEPEEELRAVSDGENQEEDPDLTEQDELDEVIEGPFFLTPDEEQEMIIQIQEGNLLDELIEEQNASQKNLKKKLQELSKQRQTL